MKFEIFDELDAGGRSTGRWAVAKAGLEPKDEGSCRWYLRQSSTPSFLSNSLEARVQRDGIVVGNEPLFPRH
jgi:hypothetical protein